LKRKEENTDFIRSIREGDVKGLDVLFRAVYPHLCAYANKFLNDIDEAEEIVQEVFYKLWKNREHLDETQSIRAYLFTAVKNSCFKFLEHQKVKDKYKGLLEYVYRLSALQDNSAHETLVAGELEKEFNKALDQLPEQCRKIFELSRFEGYKYNEIADKLKISPKTVETQMSRALHKIRLQLRDYILMLVLFVS
jgi:RNA polymerase sigma-70 factor, ECF subfamily